MKGLNTTYTVKKQLASTVNCGQMSGTFGLTYGWWSRNAAEQFRGSSSYFLEGFLNKSQLFPACVWVFNSFWLYLFESPDFLTDKISNVTYSPVALSNQFVRFFSIGWFPQSLLRKWLEINISIQFFKLVVWSSGHLEVYELSYKMAPVTSYKWGEIKPIRPICHHRVISPHFWYLEDPS